MNNDTFQYIQNTDSYLLGNLENIQKKDNQKVIFFKLLLKNYILN